MDSGRRFLYQSNDTSYKLMLLAMCLNTYYTIIYLKALDTTYMIGVFIIANIAYLLVGFLCAAKINVYSKLWTYIGVILGVIQILRIFTIPDYMDQDITVQVIIVLIIGAALSFASCALSFKRMAIIARLKGE